jgi:hypothetical protein
VGLENFPSNNTILVTPLCDNEGNIKGYLHQDLGDRGECKPASKQVVSVKVNDQLLALDGSEKITITLPGSPDKPQLFTIPILIQYSDGSTKNLIMKFNYTPPIPTPAGQTNWCVRKECDTAIGKLVCIIQEPDGSERVGSPTDEACGKTTQPRTVIDWCYKKECDTSIGKMVCYKKFSDGTEEIGSPTDEACKACPQPYPQCGGTVGLENFSTSNTILVTPICDSFGNVINYDKKDLGNRGECCDDLYYWDPNVAQCIHKWSPNDASPNCKYAFDWVEKSLCGR